MAQNRKLRDEQPERANTVDMERELTETQEENVRLASTVTQLEAERETRERETTQETEALESLTREAAALREQLQETSRRLAQAESERDAGKDWRESAERYARQLEGELENVQRDAELRELRAAAKETAKWEEREARLVQQLAELKRGVASLRAGRVEGDDTNCAEESGVVSPTAGQVEGEDTSCAEGSRRQPAVQEEPGSLR